MPTKAVIENDPDSNLNRAVKTAATKTKPAGAGFNELSKICSKNKPVEPHSEQIYSKQKC